MIRKVFLAIAGHRSQNLGKSEAPARCSLELKRKKPTLAVDSEEESALSCLGLEKRHRQSAETPNPNGLKSFQAAGILALADAKQS